MLHYEIYRLLKHFQIREELNLISEKGANHESIKPLVVFAVPGNQS